VARSNSLFKFRPFNKTSIELLVNKELWFARPDSLNDPFECQFDFDTMFDELNALPNINKSDIDRKKESAFNIFNSLGICSFSRTRKNQLMWAHYADEHKGFCIGFNEVILSKSETALKSVNVKYQSKTPKKEALIKIKGDPTNAELTLNSEAMYSIIGTKYTSWKYERERRLIIASSNTYSFTPESVVSIALGLRMPERDKDTLMQLLSTPQWNHLKWYQAEKIKGKFALDFVQIKI
jgi:hypothetical protein